MASRPAERVIAFYNRRGTAEQHIKESKKAIKWTRPGLPAQRFRATLNRVGVTDIPNSGWYVLEEP